MTLPHWYYFQFSLRQLLLAVTGLAIACSWLAADMASFRRQLEATQKIDAILHEGRGGRLLVQWTEDCPWWAFLQRKQEPKYYIETMAPTGPWDPAWLPLLRDMRSVRQLDLTANDIDDDDLIAVTNTGVKPEALRLGWCLNLTDRGFAKLGSMRCLKDLELTTTQLSDAGTEGFHNMRALECLLLSGTKVGDAGLSNLANLPNLRQLSLAGTGVTDAGLASLTISRRLESLDLVKTAVTGEGLRHLCCTQSLEEIMLGNTRIDDTTADCLLRFTALRELSLAYTAISDETVARLPTFRRLRYLDLSGTKITDKAVDDIGRLPELETLYLFHTAITAKGVDKLRSLIPKAHLIQHFPAVGHAAGFR